MLAVFVTLAKPTWARTCEQCRLYIHDDDGRIKLNMARTGPEKRPHCIPNKPGGPPCVLCPKIPANAPEKHWRYAADMTPQFMQVMYHYRTCKAVGRFPQDPIVEACAVMIAEAEKAADDAKRSRSDNRMTMLINKLLTGTTQRR